MTDQIVDKITIGIPGPSGDVSPETLAAAEASAAARDAAQAAKAGAEAARDEAVKAALAPTDPAVAALIDDPGSKVHASLSSNYAPRLRSGMDHLVAALNGAGTATVAILGPSTSVGSGNWCAGGLKRLILNRPAVGGSIFLWNDDTASPWSDTSSGAYDAGSVIQTAVPQPTYGRMIVDTFTRTAAELVGSTSNPVHAAKVWQGGSDALGKWSVNGSSLVALAAVPWSKVLLDSGATGATRMRADMKLTMDQTTASKQVAISLGGTTYSVMFWVRNISGVWSAMIWKYAATSAQVVDWTTITAAAGMSTVAVEAIMDGTTVSLTVAGQTIHGSILAADVTSIAGDAKLGLLSDGAIATGTGTQIDDLTLDIIENSTTGQVTVYNASLSGTTLEYHLPRLARMLPVEPDVIIVDSCSHNYLSRTPTDFAASVEATIGAAHTMWPNASIVLSSENPQTPPNTTRAAHAARNAITRGLATLHGWAYVPAFEAFMADGPQMQRIRADTVHPTGSGSDDGTPDPANGNYLWASTLIRTLIAAGVNELDQDIA